MNKKIFGIKISTYLTVIGCLAVAVIIWLSVKMMPDVNEAFKLIESVR